MDAATIQRRRWSILGVLCLSLFVIVVDNTIVNVALPTISRGLDATPASSNGLSTPTRWSSPACCSPPAAWATASAARAPCSSAWSPSPVCSVLAGLAQTPGQLIAARAAMGVGAALIFPATLAILTNVFTDPSERAKAIGAWAGVTGLAVALGPVTGGWILEHFAWGAIFLVNVPIAAVALLLGRVLVPTSRDPHAPGSTRSAWSSPSSASCPWSGRRSRHPPTAGPRRPSSAPTSWARSSSRLHRVGAAQHAPDARRPGLHQRPLLGRQRLGRPRVLRPVRLHLPDLPVLPGGAGLRHAVGRRPHPAVRGRHRHRLAAVGPAGPANRHEGRRGRRPGR